MGKSLGFDYSNVEVYDVASSKLTEVKFDSDNSLKSSSHFLKI